MAPERLEEIRQLTLLALPDSIAGKECKELVTEVDRLRGKLEECALLVEKHRDQRNLYSAAWHMLDAAAQEIRVCLEVAC